MSQPLLIAGTPDHHNRPQQRRWWHRCNVLRFLDGHHANESIALYTHAVPIIAKFFSRGHNSIVRESTSPHISPLSFVCHSECLYEKKTSARLQIYGLQVRICSCMADRLTSAKRISCIDWRVGKPITELTAERACVVSAVDSQPRQFLYITICCLCSNTRQCMALQAAPVSGSPLTL